MKSNDISRVKKEIKAALSHPEAEDGLYFNNLIVVHEVEERPIVAGDDAVVKQALSQMIDEGSITSQDSAEGPIFKLAR